ncbi:SAM-dependent methyltransferase [Thalassospira sp.]|uniref:SAM-dependent methyltransferase n=1 Tax=Thalassospira sp. TaxID=1912094 RepID=UPI0027372332|nr:SAM-dependent methyltransferase [Thalassospira sp.]MDP2699598.1 SAM-dependent methyltransferase [Thalassospira sp.]
MTEKFDLPDGIEAVIEPMNATGYLAAVGFEDQLYAELGDVCERHDRLMFAPGPERRAFWAQNVWRNPVRLAIPSIKGAAKILRFNQRNWALFKFDHFSRAKLIEGHLPHVSAKRQIFGQPAPSAPLGSWTLIDTDTIIAASDCSSPWKHGEIEFEEDKTTPPNRAYLKLWEAFTRLGIMPGRGDLTIDLGGSPGGWTWVLHETGASVISVDKARLDPRIGNLPRVDFRQESAFGLDPNDFGPVDWLCSDVICYPDRLYRLVTHWLETGMARNFICTIKMQGDTDPAAIAPFADIPGSKIVHLYNNKHELTWMKVPGVTDLD